LFRHSISVLPGKSLKETVFYFISCVSASNKHCFAGRMLPTGYGFVRPALDRTEAVTELK